MELAVDVTADRDRAFLDPQIKQKSEAEPSTDVPQAVHLTRLVGPPAPSKNRH